MKNKLEILSKHFGEKLSGADTLMLSVDMILNAMQEYADQESSRVKPEVLKKIAELKVLKTHNEFSIYLDNYRVYGIKPDLTSKEILDIKINMTNIIKALNR